jgi:hypothetical protein
MEAHKAELFLASAESKLEKLDSAIERLSQQRESVQSMVDKHRALLAPINRLSDDVLYQIFLTLTISCPSTTWLPNTEYPWTLGLVCKRWRELALSYAPLWATVFCNFLGAYPVTPDTLNHQMPGQAIPPIPNDAHRRGVLFRAQRLPLQLTRSKGCPLYATLSFPEAHPQLPDAYRSIYCNLMTSTDRWVRASLAGAFPPEESVPMLPPESRFAELEHLIVDNRHWLVGNVFQVAPKLKRVSLAMPSGTAINCVALPWTQLTHLEITRISHPRRIFAILPYTVNLTELALRSDRRHKASSYQNQGPPVTRVELRSLKRLVIESYMRHITGFGVFFRYLYLPSLEHLDLGEPIDSLPALLHDSRCRLKSLKARIAQEHFLVPTLAKLDHLERLQLNGEHQVCADIFVQDLIWSGGLDAEALDSAGARFLCPELKHIEFSGFDISADALIEMVDSRCAVREDLPSPARLESITARVRTADELGRTLQQLERLRLGGLSINVTSSNLSPEWPAVGAGGGGWGNGDGWGNTAWMPGEGWAVGGWSSD